MDEVVEPMMSAENNNNIHHMHTRHPALQPLLEMAYDCTTTTSTNIGTIRTLILKALSDSEIFQGFDQLHALLEPTVKKLNDGQVLLNTLSLFSQGKYRDYDAVSSETPNNNNNKYVTLTESQVLKLRQLTVVSLVQQACSSSSSSSTAGENEDVSSVSCKPPTGVVSYEVLARECGFVSSSSSSSTQEDDVTMKDNTSTSTTPNNNNNNNGVDIEALRQVEDLLISCIYAGIVSGQLCQKHQVFVVSATASAAPSSSSTTSKTSSSSGGQGQPQPQLPCRPRDVSPSEIPSLLQSLAKLQSKLKTAHQTLDTSQTHVQQNKLWDSQYWKDIDTKIAKTIMMSSSSSSSAAGGGGLNSSGNAGGGTNVSSSSGFSEGGTTGGGRSRNTQSSSRQTKRSRGGFGGVLSEAFGRY